ncbi:MAG: chromosome segregation protein SMC [Candidatus Thermoplasmatota archaeon]
MYLKQIVMENFKTFGKKVELPLLQGYTAVTGPNGSGKSNISDAILFTLGPRSAKVIRAGKLPDLIFNGGASKRPASECRVSLVFDNKDRMLPIDAEEVELTRHLKLSKSQSTEYSSSFYINGRKVNLSDFDELLSQARISADGYNFIQQGDVNSLIQKGAVERRRILEDVAGITKFDADIAKAEGERRVVEENLGKVQIILDEIGTQVKQLEHDRADALKYKEFKERLDLASAQLLYKNRETLEHQINGLTEQIKKGEAEISKMNEEKAALNSDLAAAQEEAHRIQNELNAQSTEEAKAIRAKVDGLRVECARAEDAIVTAKEDARAAREEMVEHKRRLVNLQKEMEKHSAELKRAEEDRSRISQALEAAAKEQKELEEDAAGSDEDVSRLQRSLLSLKKALDEKGDALRSALVEMDRFRATREHTLQRVAELENQHKDAEFQLKDTDWRLRESRKAVKASKIEIKQLQEAFYAVREREKSLSKEAAELESAVQRLSREYAQLKAESEAQDSVRRGYARAVAVILEARDKGTVKGIHGTIAELSKASKEHETALFTAAGARMQAIVVEDDACGAQCIQLLQRRKAGRAAFLPLNKMLDGRPRGKALMAVKESLGFAIDLIEFDERYRPAFWYVFGDTIIVNDMDCARRLMGGVRLVTLDGQLIEASGAMIGGEVETCLIRFGSTDTDRLEEVGRRLRAATEHLEKVSTSLQEARAELAERERALKDRAMETGGSGVEIEALERTLVDAKAHCSALSKQVEKTHKDLADLDAQISEQETAIAGLNQEIEGLTKERDRVNQEMMRATPQAISKRLRELQSKIAGLTKDLAEADAVCNKHTADVKVCEEFLAEAQSRISALEARIQGCRVAEKQCSERFSDLKKDLAAAEKMEAGMTSALDELRARGDASYKRTVDLEAKITNIVHKIESKQDFLSNLRMNLQNVQGRVAEAEEALSRVELKEKEHLPSTAELNSTISECEAGMRRMGDVNLKALEAYDEQQKRYSELKQELQRLKDERKRLVELVEEITSRKRIGLLTVFEGVNECFKRVYSELSEGGEAELILENMESPFDGGLHIKARPPGQKVQRIEALSGGEKALVSMAFIFAIQEYLPSPFYLLDEVDQNLDSINAGRVARMIHRNAQNAQFIQISLRHVTLKEAPHRIGVTRASDGLSQLVMDVDISQVKDTTPTPEGEKHPGAAKMDRVSEQATSSMAPKQSEMGSTPPSEEATA